MAFRKRAALLVVVLAIAMLAMVGTASAADQTYTGPYVLDANGQFMHFNEVWDLTKGDLVLRYTLDMSQITQPAEWPIGEVWVEDPPGSGNWVPLPYNSTPTTDPARYPDTYTPWIEVGMRGVGGDDFNPGPAYTYQGKCGGWMTSESDDWLGSYTVDEFGNVVLDDDGQDTQDGDDKHSLAATSGVGEWHYDVLDGDGVYGYDSGWDSVLSTFGSHNNHGLWYDRDGVDQWQADDWINSGINAPRINTAGLYHIEITYHALDAGMGVMFARVNGSVMQGFYTSGWDVPQLYPAGLSFKGDMAQMQVFAGSFAYDPWGWDYGTVSLSDIEVTGTLAVDPAGPLTPDFTATVGAGNAVSFDASATHGGMGPYTYLWDFDNDGTVDETTTTPTTTHTYATAAPYTIKLTVDPYRCKAYDVTKTVEAPMGDLTVLKFNDANANGLFDADEVPIPGWHIQVFDGETLVADDYTGTDGRVTFTLPIGTYTVKEDTSDATWTATTGDTVEVTVTAEGGTYDSMYATGFVGGLARAVEVTLDPYNPPNHAQRLNPANALGPFDADQSAQQAGVLNERFFAVASQSAIDFTFDENFFNVDGVTDIDFAEVTWGNWHTEAAKVYLTGAVVNGVPYEADDGGLGVPNYYAGIVWNKVGIVGIDPATRNSIAQGYLPGGVTRTFEDNEFYTEGNYGVSGFNLPAEVDYASDITLVDITKDVYNKNTIPTSLFAPATYTNVGGTGQRVILTGIDPFTFAALGTADGNTDGYDLDAIRVHRPVAFGNQSLEVDLAVLKSGPVWLTLGDEITYTYEVTNNGPTAAKPVLVDDKGTPADPSDDVKPDMVDADDDGYNDGDTNKDGLVDTDETWLFTFSYTPAKGTGPYNTFFNNVLTNTATVTPADESLIDTDPSNNTDSYTLAVWTLRKDVLLYWDSTNIPYSDPDTEFTVEIYKLNADGVTKDYLGTFTIKEGNRSGTMLWLSEGKYFFKEIDVPEGYTPARDWWSLSEPGSSWRDMSFENLIRFDLAVEKSGPATAVPGEVITYTYEVTNAGPAAVEPVLSDDIIGTPAMVDDDSDGYNDGDTNEDGKIQANEAWLYTAEYTVPMDAAGTSIKNVATVIEKASAGWEPGEFYEGGDTNLENNSDDWSVEVLSPQIDIVKTTLDMDGEAWGDDVTVIAGTTVTWRYWVTNPGDVPLVNVAVTDDNGTSADDEDDFPADYVSGDEDLDDELDTDETWLFEATGIAVGGPYDNVGYAEGDYMAGDTPYPVMQASDPSSYTGKTQVSVLKTVDGMDFSGPELRFQLRQGASMTSLGTVLEEKKANVGNGGLVEFVTLLLPGTYQFVELIPEGYVPSYVWGEYGVDWFRPGYEPGEGGHDPEIWVAVNFVVNEDGTIDFQNGQQTVLPGDSIDIDNQTGQMPFTIGYWKNHSSKAANNGGQAEVLDQMLYKATQAGETIQIGTLELPGGTDADNAGDAAKWATRLLNKSKVLSNKKMASDPTWNLAAQLMAYRLNQPFGAWMNPTADLAASIAQAMLVKVNFNGETYTKPSKASLAQWTADMNYLAWVLDAYNNGTLPLGQALVMPYPGVGL